MTRETDATQASEGNTQARITAYWDERGRSYDGAAGGGLHSPPHHRAWIEELRDLLPPPPGSVVDVGTGTGFLAILLSELGYDVRGYDLSEGMMAQARAKVAGLANPPRFAVGDAHDPPVQPESADLVTCRYLMWTLPDPARALAAWKRLLRPDGRLVVVDGLWWAGQEAPSAENVEDHLKKFALAYDTSLREYLPLMLTESVVPLIQVIEAAGFDVLKLNRLVRVEEVERELTSERHKWQPKYGIVARPTMSG
jgi:ubiquinone/menaquinone biosynthesis C-methylase UbiE